jgi:hypothetical protein
MTTESEEFEPETYMRIMSDELHRPARKKFKKLSVRSNGTDDIWAADIADMTQEAETIKGKKYWGILTVVDVHSKYAWAKPITSKDKVNIAKLLAEIIKESGRKPKHIWTDQGGEFNDIGKGDLAGIRKYNTFGSSKAANVERFNRTLKEMIWKRFDRNNDRKWVAQLPEIVKEYNEKVHTTIQTTPAKKSEEKKVAGLKGVLSKALPKKKMPGSKFEIGDWVRISRLKGTFEKGYIANWTRETYQVASRAFYPRDQIWKYYLKDHKGELVKGTFYEQEMQKTRLKDVYLVEKVIESDAKKGDLVKWLGYPESDNSRVNAKDYVHDFEKAV